MVPIGSPLPERCLEAQAALCGDHFDPGVSGCFQGARFGTVKFTIGTVKFRAGTVKKELEP